MNDACHLDRRGRATSTLASFFLSRGRTSHVHIENRGRAISTHRRDVLDIAISRVLLISVFAENCFQTIRNVVFVISWDVGVGGRYLAIRSFIARPIIAAAESPQACTISALPSDGIFPEVAGSMQSHS